MDSNIKDEYLSSPISPILAAIANISSSNVCVYIKDINSKYVFFSKNFQNLVGSDSYLEIGKSDYDLWDNRLATAFRKDDLVVLKSKEPHISKYLTPKGKELVWIKTEKIPILDKQNNPIGILCIVEDLSHKKIIRPKEESITKTQIRIKQRNPAAIVLEVIEEYIRNNYKNQINLYDEYSFIRNSFIKKLSCELTTKNEQHLFSYINLENQLKRTLSIFIENRELIIIGTGKVKYKYYIYLVICLCFIELYKNKSLREKIMINIDDNTIRLMINRAGERYRFCIDDNHSDHKFITNYLTSDIVKLLNLDLEIFTIDGLVSAVNVIIDNQDITLTD
ncbi:diguanylate cyclase [Francisella persica ATCC VR-331]|uniref:Diguanylate cyclase n=1 Tax=Francisella persica ATCC VR-331 TaxID=1086726 RepID=A0AAC8VDC6_9GAMM|nr:PAS domain-containing protein [Francisella persica]ALB01541.1 diguanylate cyclase [Francisella persica ATCC VR-331]ANH77833.1 diguanylate cyclase [Francisella persica ATCC VR-331]